MDSFRNYPLGKGRTYHVAYAYGANIAPFRRQMNILYATALKQGYPYGGDEKERFGNVYMGQKARPLPTLLVVSPLGCEP